MSTYIVTTSNWNDPAFWNGISETGPGHTLDFSALPSNFNIDFWPGNSQIIISDGTTSFEIGDSDDPHSNDAQMAGTTQLEYFTTIISSQGDGVLDGSSNSDTIEGGDGYDQIIGNEGDDQISGNAGDDFLEGNDGSDTVFGGIGNDTLEGGADDDVLHGEEDDDELHGGAGADTLEGGDGNDTLQGQWGNDSLSGGDGDDLIQFSDMSDTDTVAGGEGGTDTDTIEFISGTSVNVTFTGDEAGTYATSSGTTAGSFTEIEAVTGGYGDDTINAASSNADQILSGGDGSDSITGGGANDTIDGGDDNDTISGGAGDDYIDAGDGNDLVESTSAAQGNDTIYGGAGNDTLEHNLQTDLVDGGIGDDRIINVHATGSTDITTIIGGEGTDTYVLDNSQGGGFSSWQVVDLSTGEVRFNGNLRDTLSEIENIELNENGAGAIGDNSANEITAIGDFYNNLQGGGGNDTIDGGGGSDLIDGGDGNDSLIGGLGNDTISGGDGDDYIEGGDGDDFLTTGLGNDTLIGGEGNDTLMNSDGDDSLVGGAGNDSIIATGGNDTLEGGTGDDTLDGGADDDSLEGGEGNDSLEGGQGSDTLSGGEGQDVLSGGSDWVKVNNGDTLTGTTDQNYFQYAATSGSDATVTLDDGAGSTTDGDSLADYVLIDAIEDDAKITIRGFDFGTDKIVLQENAFVTSSVASEGWTRFNISYSNGNTQQITVSHSGGMENVLSDFVTTTMPTTSADVLDGGADEDTFLLDDNFGNDTIIGGEGGLEDSDTIDGGALTDDVTVLASGDEAGTITDGTDTLSFSEIENIFTGSGDDSIDARADSSGLGLFGGSGSDTIQSGSGDDYIEGGDDADVILFEDGFDDDTVIGGEGGDDDDLIDLSSLTGSVDVDYSSDEAGRITQDSNSILFSQTERLVLTDYADQVDARDDSAGIDIDLGAGNDSLTDGDGNDRIIAGDGDDHVMANDGDDTIEGGEGDDEIEGGGDADLIDGGAGNDFLAGFDVNGLSSHSYGINTDDGSSDTLLGGSGSDTLLGGRGSDSIDGGDDQDSIIIQDNFGNDTITGGEGGTDSDTIDLSELNGPVTVNYTGVESGTITDGTDTITFSEIEQLILTDDDDVVVGTGDTVGIDVRGEDGNDSILGGDGDDTIDGGDDSDTIDGGAGNDRIELGDERGSGNSDLVYGGSGQDTITSSETSSDSRDTVFAGEGNDVITMAGGQNELRGDAGNDTITGGDDEDTIYGGTGDDSIDGGSDADSIILEDNFGSDTIAGGEWGTDDDTLDLNALTTGVNLSYSGNESGNITSGSNTADFSEIENIVLTNQSDIVDGSATTAGMTFSGLGGEDMIEGGSGDDSLSGDDGSDTLIGGGGADSIDGGSGNDNLTGGDGDDVFVVSGGDDTITDFNTGNSGALRDGDATNNDFIDLSAYYTDMVELRADFNDDQKLNQSTGDYTDNTSMSGGSLTFDGASRSNFTADNTGVVCFSRGTAIRTPRGDVLIEDLRVGDKVNTADNGPQPIRWIGTRKLNQQALSSAPNLRPVLIKAQALANERPLLVSQQHCMMLGSDKLVRAKHLAGHMPGVRIANGKRSVCYIHLMFDAHQIIFAEGAPSESFYPGPMSLRMISTEARTELFSIFPELRPGATSQSAIVSSYGKTARLVAKRRDLGNLSHLFTAPSSRSGHVTLEAHQTFRAQN